MSKIFLIKHLKLTILALIVLSCSSEQTKLPNNPKRTFGEERTGLITYLDSALVQYMDSVFINNEHDYLIMLYQTSGNFIPSIEQLICLQFNLSDSIIYSSFITSKIGIKGKKEMPFRCQNVNWYNKFFNPVDTLLQDIEKVDFWEQQPEIRVDGEDGYSIIIEIKQRDKSHYLLRWSPNYSALDKYYPKRKEFIKLCSDIRKFAIGEYYKNEWDYNW